MADAAKAVEAEVQVEGVRCQQQVVYADPQGECHLQLPVFVDTVGACHVSLNPKCDSCVDQDALAHICMGSCAAADVSRREHRRSILERALSQDSASASPERDSAHRKWLQGELTRIGTMDLESAEAKDALRRAVLLERKEAASASGSAGAQGSHAHSMCFLTYTEQRHLLSSH